MTMEAWIVALGLLAGLVSGRTGLGGGAALLVLPWLGVSWPMALLAAKLPIAAADAAAWWASERGARTGGESRPGHALAAAATAAAAALAWIHGPALLAPLVCAASLALALWAQRQAVRPVAALAWSAYIGGLGMGAGLLYRAAAPSWSGWHWAPPAGWRRTAAVANAAAVAALLVFAPMPDAAEWALVGLLALSQAAAAALGAWLGRSRPGPSRPPMARARVESGIHRKA